MDKLRPLLLRNQFLEYMSISLYHMSITMIIALNLVCTSSYHRSPSIGLYSQLRKIDDLPYPEAVFDGSFFARNPKPFYTLVRQIYPQRLCPTDTHKFMKLLERKGLLQRVYTQNIDAIEFLAGLPAEKVVEAHGTFQRSYCTACHKNFDLEWLKDNIFHPGLLRILLIICKTCG